MGLLTWAKKISKDIFGRRETSPLFQPIASDLYHGLAVKKDHADTVFIPAFDRIFLLLKAFYSNRLRGDILEFGVMQGYTARLLAEGIRRFKLKECRLHLFDSFEGLPKTTEVDNRSYECVNGFWKEGSMCVETGLDRRIEAALRARLGEHRVFAKKGFFEQTLDSHIAEYQIAKAVLVNLDCDLYSSSLFVLKTLFEKKIIQDGTILICDDWMTSFGNPNMGQRRAVEDILKMYPQWQFEPYFNYGIGSQVFILHDLSITCGRHATHN